MTVIEQIKAMSGKEIVMTMVQALREPMIEINMRTFGSIETKDDGTKVCFGCAATAFLCRLAGSTKYIRKKYSNEAYNHYSYLLGKEEKMLNELNNIRFIDEFEGAIDLLRQGRINGYNHTAQKQKFAVLIANDTTHGYLPELKDDYNDFQLQEYENFANYQ